MKAAEQAQKNHYEKIAAQYDQTYHRENSNHLYKIEEIEKCFSSHFSARPPGYDFLEVGAGTGIHAYHFLKAIPKHIRSLTLSDLSGEMLAQAGRRLRDFPQIKYLVSPAEKLQTSETFDGIYVSGAVHHFAQPSDGIREMSSHLRPGGLLVVCEPIVWNPINFVRATVSRLDWGQFQVTRTNVRQLIESTGLQIVVDRALHWRGPGPVSRRLWPYQALEKVRFLSPFAIMYLLAARKK